jgi:hypothetical protein
VLGRGARHTAYLASFHFRCLHKCSDCLRAQVYLWRPTLASPVARLAHASNPEITTSLCFLV